MKAHLLLSLGGLGALWSSVFFLLFFFAVHFTKLAKRGWIAGKKKPPPKKEPPKEEKPTVKPVEPVYYIVERKKKRTKSSYGEPKEFRFK